MKGITGIDDKYPSISSISSISSIRVDVYGLKEGEQKDEALMNFIFSEDILKGYDINCEVCGIKICTDGSIEQKSRAFFELINATNTNYNYNYFIRIVMPCGSEKIFKTMWDFPKETVLCDCGNPNHYFVKYL